MDAVIAESYITSRAFCCKKFSRCTATLKKIFYRSKAQAAKHFNKVYYFCGSIPRALFLIFVIIVEAVIKLDTLTELFD